MICFFFYTDSNGCKDSAIIHINVIQCTGIEDLSNGFSVQLYPNPTTGIITLSLISSKGGKVNIEITDALGQKVDMESYSIIESFPTRFDRSFLTNGIYHFKVAMGQQSQVFKVVNVK